MRMRFSGAVWYWRGPAPYHFVTVPEEECELISEVSNAVTYGWGMIPAAVRIGATSWTTSLWPKDGGYIVPLKAWVREAEGVDVDDVVDVELEINVGR
jgi:hypothetical protein